MKVNIVSADLVKPLTPTPQTLSKHKLSFLDELAHPLYVTVVLYYSKPSEKDAHHINNLKQSLAKTLSQFYTFAGRNDKNNKHAIDCNDFGAEYIEAEALDTTLSDFIAGLETNHFKMIAHILPLGSQVLVKDDDPLLAVRLTKFECGGFAIAVNVSHKIADAESILSFLTVWSNAQTAETLTYTPDLTKGPTLLPSKKDWPQHSTDDEPPPDATDDAPRVLVRKFSFKNKAIERLKSKLIMDNDRRVSKVVMVSALIAKALADIDRSKHGRYRSSFITHAVNLRERTNPSIPRNSCGNFVTTAFAEISNSNGNMGFEGLVSLIGDSIRGRVQECAEKMFDGDGHFDHGVILGPLEKMIPNFTTKRDEVNVMWFTDWSKFGFYDIDFGWGKPVMTGHGAFAGLNMIVLMGNKDGDGIEARVHLSEDEMIAFEQHDDIKIHALI